MTADHAQPSEGMKLAVEPSPDLAPNMMNQADIVAFLAAQGVEPLCDWRPGEAVLYVVEDPFRTETSHYGDLPERLRPSVARLDRPDSVEACERAVGSDGLWFEVFRIVNGSGGQVDYYAIDAETHGVTFVRSSGSVRDKTYPYVASGTLLFRAADALFPKA